MKYEMQHFYREYLCHSIQSAIFILNINNQFSFHISYTNLLQISEEITTIFH